MNEAKTRRSRGDGGLHWDEPRRRWIATAHLGYGPDGRRIAKRGSGRTKTEAKAKLKEVLRDYEDGLTIAPSDYTVRRAVEDWLRYGLLNRSAKTVEVNDYYCRVHVIPGLGARKLRELTATDVERWLEAKARVLSTRTLQGVYSALNRSVKRADMARDKVKRNVVELCAIPEGLGGRPSKSLTMAQAAAVLTATATHRMHCYVVVSLLTGARTEELRALTWTHVDLDGDPDATPPLPPYVAVWRSVRKGGDTKTKKSRRTLALPDRCVKLLRGHRLEQEIDQRIAADRWHDTDLVFTTKFGTQLDAPNIRREFRSALRLVPGIAAAEWTPRELRHSFVSVLADNGVSVEEISQLVGHRSTAVTELVYRHQLRPVMQRGAVVMNDIFRDVR